MTCLRAVWRRRERKPDLGACWHWAVGSTEADGRPPSLCRRWMTAVVKRRGRSCPVPGLNQVDGGCVVRSDKERAFWRLSRKLSRPAVVWSWSAPSKSGRTLNRDAQRGRRRRLRDQRSTKALERRDGTEESPSVDKAPGRTHSWRRKTATEDSDDARRKTCQDKKALSSANPRRSTPTVLGSVSPRVCGQSLTDRA